VAALFFLPAAFMLAGCDPSNDPENCLACHQGLEPASPSHHGCKSCHGGDGATRDKAQAHRGMLGPANPSAPATWDKGCGSCHKFQLDRVNSTIMTTNQGMIRNIQATWDGADGREYGVSGSEQYDSTGKPLQLKPVAELNNLSGELYRKFCARCHISSTNDSSYAATHGAGCAACHFPWSNDGTYTGKDRTMKGRAGHSASHRIVPLPDSGVCTRCHNRSGRIGFSYQGLYDGNNGLVPTSNGELGPVAASGARNLVHIAPDIHFSRGMECIDCHTSRDVMGDGYAYRNMYLQTEIACEDCHGSSRDLPRYREIVRENDDALRESRSYRQPMQLGMRMIQTARGRSYANVFYRDNAVWLEGKISGKLHRAKVITNTPEHTVAGHDRLDCHTCHSRTVVQCYGCHTRYDAREQGQDFITGQKTPGAFSETEDYRTLYPFPLAVNQRGKISPVTPGCQTFVTTVAEDGTTDKSEYVATFKGSRQLRFAPFFSHNTGTRAVGCSECHGNPAFLGFGQHVMNGNTLRSTLLCEHSDTKPLDGFLTMIEGKVRSFSAITREYSRPLNDKEVRRSLSVNLCLPCHGQAKDPIYRKGISVDALDDARHRRILSGH